MSACTGRPAAWQPWYPLWADIDIAAEAVRHIERIGLAVPGLNERLRCYQVVIELDNQTYCAFKGVSRSRSSRRKSWRPWNAPSTCAALARLKVVEEARDQVIELLQRTPFGRADLAVIRDVVAALEASARQTEEQAVREDVLVGQTEAPIRRVGSVWIEMKYIADAVSRKVYGPCIYGRWRADGRKRWKYIGKAS